MAQTTMSSRDFHHNLAAAKRAAENGPVVVTDRDKPAFVLMDWDTYRRLSDAGGASLVDLLRQDGAEADFQFDPPRLGELLRPVEF